MLVLSCIKIHEVTSLLFWAIHCDFIHRIVWTHLMKSVVPTWDVAIWCTVIHIAVSCCTAIRRQRAYCRHGSVTVTMTAGTTLMKSTAVSSNSETYCIKAVLSYWFVFVFTSLYLFCATVEWNVDFCGDWCRFLRNWIEFVIKTQHFWSNAAHRETICHTSASSVSVLTNCPMRLFFLPHIFLALFCFSSVSA